MFRLAEPGTGGFAPNPVYEIEKALMEEKQLWKERCQETLAIIPLNLNGHLLLPEWEREGLEGVASHVASGLRFHRLGAGLREVRGTIRARGQSLAHRWRGAGESAEIEVVSWPKRPWKKRKAGQQVRPFHTNTPENGCANTR